MFPNDRHRWVAFSQPLYYLEVLVSNKLPLLRIGEVERGMAPARQDYSLQSVFRSKLLPDYLPRSNFSSPSFLCSSMSSVC